MKTVYVFLDSVDKNIQTYRNFMFVRIYLNQTEDIPGIKIKGLRKCSLGGGYASEGSERENYAAISKVC